MPRKRASKKSIQYETKVDNHIEKKPQKSYANKNWVIAFGLIAIFILVLFLNTYFNVTSEVVINPIGETFQEKFYLSGPDPYYNMRTIAETLKTGAYPYGVDPMLNYPLGISGSGGGARPPLFNMITIGFSKILSIGMSEMDSIGYAMQFIPALFGALLIFPVYFTGKALFNKKVGLIAAMFVAIIPVHIGSGHGSAYSLFDHDSFNLFLFSMIYLFFIYALQEKNAKKSTLYAAFSGLFLGALSLTWVEARFAYAVLMVFIIIQLIINLLKRNLKSNVIRVGLVSILIGNLIATPLFISKFLVRGLVQIDLSLILLAGIILLAIVFYIIKKLNIPWIISLPSMGVLGCISYSAIYFLKDAGIPAIRKIYSILAGVGVYGNKVSLTIAEAGTSSMSNTVMYFGPALFWIATIGFALLIYRWLKEKHRIDYFFIIVLFIIDLWLISIAGRFINDLVPLVAILGAWVTYLFIDKIDYKKMVKNIKDIGGLRGLRKGVRFTHICGILFVIFLILVPNTYLALYTGIPSGTEKKQDIFGSAGNQGVYGLSLYKEMYWVDALMWLNEQDLEIENPLDRPAFISWWDYGFYESAVGEHPTVADNFQHGISCAANFHTAKNEYEAISVLILRLIHGDSLKNNEVSNATETVLRNYLPVHNDTIQIDENNSKNVTYYPADDIIRIVEDPTTALSYNKLIAPEWGNENLKVGEERPENAMYHDGTKILTQNLTDEEIINLYQDIQNSTGFSIRYYGVEGYDMYIFNVFTFLGDKGTYGYVTSEDDYYQIVYEDKYGNQYTGDEISNLTDDELSELAPFDNSVIKKDAYYDTMVYQTYKGIQEAEGLPTYGLKHFVPKYISPYPYSTSQYPAVIIAKYYPGGTLKGTVSIDGDKYGGAIVYLVDEYGIPHDSMYTDVNGEFNLVSLPGNLTIAVQFGQHLVKQVNVTVTEDAANRIGDYIQTVNISIDKGNISGYVLNSTIADAIILAGKMYSINETGYYEFNDIIPGDYNVQVYSGNLSIYDEQIFIQPNEQLYNITIEYIPEENETTNETGI